MNLASLEALFFRAARGKASTAELDQHFVGRGPRSGAGRMRIYNGAYFTRLEGAFADTFPATRVVLGETRFVALARRCIIHFPSRHPALEFAGESFPLLLSREAGRDEQLAAQVATLEWARLEALTAPDDGLVEQLSLAGVDPAHVRFHWAASLRFCATTLSAFRTFHAPEQHEEHRAGADADCHVTLAVWRKKHGTEYRTLEALEAEVLAGESHSIRLLTVCERLSDAAPDPVASAFRLIRRWLAQGFIARVEFESSGGESPTREAET